MILKQTAGCQTGDFTASSVRQPVIFVFLSLFPQFHQLIDLIKLGPGSFSMMDMLMNMLTPEQKEMFEMFQQQS